MVLCGLRTRNAWRPTATRRSSCRPRTRSLMSSPTSSVRRSRPMCLSITTRGDPSSTKSAAVSAICIFLSTTARWVPRIAPRSPTLARAKARPTRVLVLTGGPDFWSNGIHLNLIEAADNPADESWRNINAMNDVVREIILADRQLTIAAVAGNAGAGGVFLALAADHVYAREGVILNPHYKGMGNL